jgi:hypothetical protein
VIRQPPLDPPLAVGRVEVERRANAVGRRSVGSGESTKYIENIVNMHVCMTLNYLV